MSTQLSVARTAIEAEIRSLVSQQKKLESVLAQLGGDSDTASIITTEKKRGRKPGSKNKASSPAVSSEADLAKALELLKAAGKPGIKAIKLSYDLRNAGHTKVGKVELLGTEKVKMTGKGGASTYVYTA